jgi:hypothetical protein
VLAHTYSSDAYHAIRVNGQEVGEIALDAAVAMPQRLQRRSKTRTKDVVPGVNQ